MLTRRNLLRAGMTSGLGLGRVVAGSSVLALAAPRSGTGTGTGRAKAVILLYMNGGPSHIDTWDPKSGEGRGAREGDQDERARRDDQRAHAAARAPREQARDRARHDEQGGQPPARAVPPAHRLLAEPDRRASVARGVGGEAARRAGDGPARQREPRRSEPRRGLLRRAVRSVRRADARDSCRRTSGYGPGVDDARFEARKSLLDGLDSASPRRPAT